MTLVFDDSYREAVEPPTVKIDDKEYVGKLIPFDLFMDYEAKFLPMLNKDEYTVEDVIAQRELVVSFLNDVFPPDIPPEPDTPAEDMNLFERVYWWITGKAPKRWKAWKESYEYWELQKESAEQESASKAILASPHIWEIIASLFTHARRRGLPEVPTSLETESKAD